MSILNRIYARLVIGDIKETDKEPNVDEWMNFLSKMPPADDYISNTYNKYLCRQFHFPIWKRFIMEVAAFPLMIKVLFENRKVSLVLPNCKENSIFIEEKTDLKYDDIIPEDLINKYSKSMSAINNRDSKLLKEAFSIEAIKLLKPLVKKYWYHPYMIVWCYRELKKHSTYIMTYNPKATVVYVEERNIATPLIKQLYKNTGRDFISFMHGEYLLRLIQGYMGFSKYYIWDESYIDTFSSVLKCDIDEYVLYKPKKLEKKWDLENSIPTYYCTYYFSAESKESIHKLGGIFKNFEKEGKRCKVRPHPRYSQLDVIREVFPEYMIEDPKKINIEQSLRDTKYVVGLATTVLAEAYYEGREVVIDDITSVEKYNNLKKRRFVSLKRPHILFSELLKDEKSDI